MKTKITLLALAFLLPAMLWAQAPQAITYQAIARNAQGAVLMNQSISLRLSIKNTQNGAAVYQETQTGLTTNEFGLFTVEIGRGIVVSGTFAAIDWSSSPKYIKVEFDPTGGTNYLDMGTTELLSVPYALYAATSGSGGGGDNWGTQTAVTNATLTGNGTGGTPLGIAQQGAANGQVLKWNGTTWAPATQTDNDNQTLSISGTQLSITGGNSITLPAGGSADNWGTETVITDASLTGNGTSLSPLGVAHAGATSGQVLTWNGSAWAPANATGTTYTAGTGISISGTTITNTLPNQQVSITGTGGTTVTGTYPNFTVNSTAGTTYTAGTGISISGTTITNTQPDKSVAINAGNGISVTGTYPTFTVAATGAGGGISGSGTNNFITKFTPNGTTVGNSLLQDDATTIGLGVAPDDANKLLITAGSSTGGLKINQTSATVNSYGLNVNSTAAGNGYLGFVGTIGTGGISVSNAAVYGSSTTSAQGPGVIAITSGAGTSVAAAGISSVWHGGLFASATSDTTSGVIGAYEGTTAGFGVSGTFDGQADGGVGTLGYNNRATGALNIGVEGAYNTTSFGAGVVGVGFGGSIPPDANNDIGVWGSSLTGNGFAVYANGDFVSDGVKSASVPTSKGNQLVYCMESPEVWFEDFGHATLVNGQVTITLDNLFLETVQIDNDHPMIVTVTPEGDCKGLYVVPGSNSFTVKELNGGNSSINFSYRITCKRANYQNHRFGSDITWGSGDTRTKYHYIAPRPVDYNAAVSAIQEAKHNGNFKKGNSFKKQTMLSKNTSNTAK